MELGSGLDAEARIAALGQQHELLSEAFKLGVGLGEIEPLAQYLVGTQLGKLGDESRVPIARGADHEPVPGFLTILDGEKEPAIEVGSVETEQSSAQIARLVFKGFEKPQERVFRFGFRFHD